MVFEKGHAISPGTIGLLNSTGRVNVDVFEKPTVRIIATGDELVKPGNELKEGQIYASNGETISGALKSYGFACKEHIQIQDDYPSILQGIKNCLDSSDILLLSGGISVGEYDFVKKALEENGVEEVFYKVFQKPGKPLFFGRKENKCVFGLPGNPASSLTCFYVYVLPLLQKMAGGHGTGLRR
ncbi:MAG: molybdopterin molybdotransferase MoeA, partial [Bacteroidota bacterium]